MASHQELADFIKSVHINLRLRSREIGPSLAWEEHCAKKGKLEKYASAMYELASVHWEKNNGESCELSRIYWVLKQIEWYFQKGGKSEFFAKENKLSKKFSIDCIPQKEPHIEIVSLLDVGSCYNPFSKYPHLDVTAIDLSPAASTGVFKCDFLSVAIGESLITDSDGVCRQLPCEKYDVVLFSLLLEYMPSPEQRFCCCSKAGLLLRKSGILLVLTPDSKHASANSQLVKNWRLALASIGFLLVKTEKLKHIRCLVFAKSNNSSIPKRWLNHINVAITPEEAIAIPQDKNLYEVFRNEETSKVKDDVMSERNDSDNNFINHTFSHLLENDLFN